MAPDDRDAVDETPIRTRRAREAGPPARTTANILGGVLAAVAAVYIATSASVGSWIPPLGQISNGSPSPPPAVEQSLADQSFLVALDIPDSLIDPVIVGRISVTSANAYVGIIRLSVGVSPRAAGLEAHVAGAPAIAPGTTRRLVMRRTGHVPPGVYRVTVMASGPDGVVRTSSSEVTVPAGG